MARRLSIANQCTNVTGIAECLARPVRLYIPSRRLTLHRRVVYLYWTVSASQDPRSAVGLIGLGNMGSAFAERLLDAGYQLVVHNRDRRKTEPLAGHAARP